MLYSATCWKTAAAVDRDMKNLNSNSSKLLDSGNIERRHFTWIWNWLQKQKYQMSGGNIP